jgi:type III secretion system regulator LcrR
MAPPVDLKQLDESLPESSQYAHPLTLALIAEGLEITPMRLSRHSSSMFLGLRFEAGASEIVYRLIDPQNVIVVLYRRLKEISGLRNPFKDFIWFLEFLTRKELGLERVMGMTKQLSGSPGGLSSRRIAKFYKECLNAKTLGWHGENEWVYLDLKDYKTLRQCRAERKLMESGRRRMPFETAFSHCETL